MTTNLKIAKASLILICASVLGHVLSLGKEVLVAKYFGISRQIDAFYAAFTIPNFTANIFVLLFSILFIPLFIKQKEADRDSADRVASALMSWAVLALFLISAALFLFPSQIVSAAFNGLDLYSASKAAGILRILSLALFLTGIVGMLTYLLNAFEHFSGPAFSQMFITVSIIAFMVFFAPSWGIYTVVWGTVMGLSLQAALLVFLVRNKGFRYTPGFGLGDPSFREIAGSTVFVGVITVLSSVNIIVNRVMAAYLPAGSIAALAYADKLVQVPLIIFSGSVNTAIYPFFAIQVAQDKIDELKDTLASSIKMSGLVFIPAAAAFLVFAEPLVHALFQRGAFNAPATAITSAVLVCYSFQLVVFYAMVIMMRLLFAMQDYKSLIAILIANVLANAVFNYVFMKIITPPAAGIALSTSAVCLLTSILFFIRLKQKIQFMHGISILRSLSKVTLLTLVSALVMRALFLKLSSFVQYSTFNYLGLISCSAIAGAVLFIALAYLINLEEMLRLLNLARNKIPAFVGLK
jgi:putative peptidoglycan lipid II flippase